MASWARMRAAAPPWPRRHARAAAPLLPHGRACELRLRHGLMGACVRHRGREASSGREQRAPAPPLPQIHDASARSSPCCRRPLLRFSFNGGRPAAGTEKERGRKKNGLTSWAKGNLGKSSPFLAETGARCLLAIQSGNTVSSSNFTDLGCPPAVGAHLACPVANCPYFFFVFLLLVSRFLRLICC